MHELTHSFGHLDRCPSFLDREINKEVAGIASQCEVLSEWFQVSPKLIKLLIVLRALLEQVIDTMRFF